MAACRSYQSMKKAMPTVKRWRVLPPLLFFAFLLLPPTVGAQSADQIPKNARCPVCGMFVAPYPHWVARIVRKGKPTLYFDGVKDMMAYYFHPGKYGGHKVGPDDKILVRDYYTLKSIDGRKAYYVGGSDVWGPMGNELVPFSSKGAAKSFLADHKGKKILAFGQITDRYVEALREGLRMR